MLQLIMAQNCFHDSETQVKRVQHQYLLDDFEISNLVHLHGRYLQKNYYSPTEFLNLGTLILLIKRNGTSSNEVEFETNYSSLKINFKKSFKCCIFNKTMTNEF
ncbi:Protein of unknown function [Gryllus bimaculatus]|nr:Protein of unknown function [Gryllus bimaculatus]